MSVFDSISDTLAKLRGGEFEPVVPHSEPNEPQNQPTTHNDTPTDQPKPSSTSLAEIADMVVPTPPKPNYYPLDYESPVLPQAGSIPFHLWESLAYDLALGHPPSDDLAQAYSSTMDDLLTLMDSPYFQKLLNAKKEEVEKVGPRASTVTKFRVITSMGMREYMRRVTSPDTSDKDFHALFKLALEMAELTPPPVPKEGGVQIDIGSKGDGMTFNIYGIPGLGHMQNGMTDVTPPSAPTPTDDTLDDAEVVEVSPAADTPASHQAPPVMETL